METFTTQETDVAPVVPANNTTTQDLLTDNINENVNVDDVLMPAKTESSNVSSIVDNNLIADKSENSPPLVEPLLEKEIELPSSISIKEKETSDAISTSAVKDFLNEAKSDPNEISEPIRESESFGFNKPLPPEPFETTSDFLKAEKTTDIKSSEENYDNEFVGAAGDISPFAISRGDSPIPPPIPKHQDMRDESPDRFESSPEPDFKPMEPSKQDEDIINTKLISPKQEEVKGAPIKEEKKINVGDIGAKDIIVEIDAWFNPARLHPQVESLVYWRDPKKSGAVFGIFMVILLSLTCFSLISVVAYLGLLTLAGTISFRIYKNIMQAVQKTSDGHPFKEYLEMEISLPEEKVAETSRIAAQQLNAAISALRSLFLVEDLVDSIKGLVLFWTLTYVGAVFNGLTLLIIGVILIFSLPRLYEKNKVQVDGYIQIGMDKLSVITNRMKAALPSGKKDEKPKDQ